MPAKINKRKASALLEQAKLHLALGQADKAEVVLNEVAHGAELDNGLFFALLADAQDRPGRLDDVIATLTEGLSRFSGDADLEVRMGHALMRQDKLDEGIAFFERARPKLRRDPNFLTQYAFALVRVGRLDDAEAAVGDALAGGGGLGARLVLAVARGHRGRYAEALEIASEVERAGKTQQLVSAARSVKADCMLFLGDAPGALAAWKALRLDRQLEEAQFGHMAYAAQLSGDPALCDELIAKRLEGGATAEDLLLFAQVANLRSKPEEALAHLEASDKARGERYPGHDFEVLATKGRSLRLLGKRDEARAALEKARTLPEFQSARLGPRVRVDLGHLYAEEGDFERADGQFREALAADPDDPEAQHGLALTSRRVAWRDEVEASAEAKVEAAKAETEALKRRFSSREGELEALRREVQRMKAAKAEAEAAARRAETLAHRAAEEAAAVQQRKVREELAVREAEAAGKARENLDRALGELKGRCPPGLAAMLEVAEQTFQKAMYTELPAAAVAVLYSGALERALYIFFVERFDAWLEERGRREPFLQGAVREKRGKKVEYFDHFVEAFDRDRAGRAPAMGEVGRVLERRHEPYLEPFAAFLGEHYGVADGFYDALAKFVLWSKETLRDPVAHGRGMENGYDELKRFREELLFGFAGAPHGALAQLLAPAKG